MARSLTQPVTPRPYRAARPEPDTPYAGLIAVLSAQRRRQRCLVCETEFEVSGPETNAAERRCMHCITELALQVKRERHKKGN